MPPLLDNEGQGPGGVSHPLSHEGGRGALPVENTDSYQVCRGVVVYINHFIVENKFTDNKKASTGPHRRVNVVLVTTNLSAGWNKII